MGISQNVDAEGDHCRLSPHKALALVFRAKLLAALAEEGLTLPADFPEKWVVDCKCVGNGHKALASYTPTPSVRFRC